MADKFKIETDRYGGVIVEAASQTFASPQDFVRDLKAAMPQWKAEQKRGLWIKVDHGHSALVPLLSEMGLEFHHAQPGYVMMTTWLCDVHPNLLPEYANQYVGVAGFVLNEKNQLLVVQELYHSNKRSPWKLPGGHADKGEDLMDTAVREVLEETGVQCKFKSLIAFRHQHQYRFGCSDLYFICLLEPLTQEIKFCPHEIAACQWMDLDEYVNNKEVAEANRHFVQCYKDSLSQGGLALVPTKVLSYNRKSLFNIYSIQNISSPRPDHVLPDSSRASSSN